MVCWADIVWAAIALRDLKVLPEGRSFDEAYLNIIRNEVFLERLRYNPQDLDVSEIRNVFVEFLNRWGCRLRNYDNNTASNLKKCLERVHSDFREIQNYSILDFDLESAENKERIKRIYNSFWNYGSPIARNFGPTATSKAIHIVNPGLFVIWDNKIRLHYWIENRGIDDSGKGYVYFLVEIKRIAKILVNECRKRFDVDDPALWLSQKLNITPPHSLTKFIDEFDWLVYTKGLSRPADWICPF